MKKIGLIGPLFIIIAAIFWGIDGIVLTPALYTLPVPLVVFIEHALVFAMLLPFFIAEIKQVKKFQTADWFAFFWIAIFGGVIGTMFITKALFYVNFVNLSIVILIQKLQPVFALILAKIVLKEKMPKDFWRWSVLALVATYFITFSGLLPNFHTGDKTSLAALFALGAAFAWGSSTVFGKRALKNASFRMSTYLRFGLATLIMAVIASTTGSFGAIGQITKTQLMVFAIMIFTSGGTAMFLYYYGLKRVTASVSTICELAFPLTAIMLEYFVHHNSLSLIQWLAAAVLFFAIYKVSTLKKAVVI
ncbi:MAG: DMT family transporter [Patescibacteria group bacterium]|nr:DMT family transporter [Patescibacteria group bacterium]